MRSSLYDEYKSVARPMCAYVEHSNYPHAEITLRSRLSSGLARHFCENTHLQWSILSHKKTHTLMLVPGIMG